MHNIVKDIPLWSVTIWDKNFSGVDRNWQPRTIKYKYLLSDELDQINIGGDVCLLYTGKDIGFTNEQLAGDALCEGEIVSIPWGGTPSVKYYNGRFVTGDNRIATSSKPEELLNKYLYYYLKGHLREISSYYRGAGLKHPSMKDVLKMTISYPDIDTQKRIIAQFEHLERVISLREQEINRFDELIKARFVEMFGDILHESKYPSVQLNELVDIGSSKRIFANEYVQEGIPFYRSKEIRELGSGMKPSVELFISPERYNDIRRKFGVPRVGDILIAAIGATIGYSWIVNTDSPFYYKDGNLILLSLKDRVNPVFLNHAMGILIEDFKSKGVAGSAQLALTIEKLEKMTVVNPEIELQKKFAEFVKQVDKSKSVVQKSLDEAQLLFDSLMQEYFG